MDDIVSRIGAIRREVAAQERSGHPVRVVIADRTYVAEIGDVWDALTNAERIPRWFLPVTGDLRPGGRYQLEGNAGGEITTCDPPRHLAVTWEYGDELGWVDVRLSEGSDCRTQLRLEHAGHDDDDRWDEFGPGAVGVGWDMAITALEEHLSTGGAVDGDRWMASAEGKEFMRRSSDAWCAASITAGTPEEAARLAAGRTTAAYTGEEAPAGS